MQALIQPHLVLLIILGHVILVSPSYGLKSRLLDVPKFRLQARIVQKYKSSDNFASITTNELYSNEQQRARIELSNDGTTKANRASNTKGSDTYFYDGQRVVKMPTESISEDHSAADCAKSDVNRLIRDLLGKSADESGKKYWLSPVFKDVPKHIIGLARFLYYVDANSDKLVLEDATDNFIRNQACNVYAMKMPDWGQTKDFNLTVYVPRDLNPLWDGQGEERARQADGVGHQLTFPIRVAPDSSAGNFFFFIEFSLIQPMYDTPFYELEHSLDDFCYPIGCSSGLRDSSKNAPKLPDDLIIGLQQKVFSMHVELEDFTRLTKETSQSVERHFVAYDGYQFASRYDSIGQNSDGSGYEYSTTIHDIVTKRKYNIRQALSSQAASLSNYLSEMRTLKYSPQRHGSDKQCVVVESSTIDYEPIFRFDQFVELGMAHVRGAKARVFEQVGDRYPPILFHHVSFRGLDSIARSYFDLTTKNNSKGNAESKTFVFYFAADQRSTSNSSTIGPLMRVDVIGTDGRLRFRLEIIDFIWQLSDAPNGDRQDELFSLRDYCSGDQTRVDRLATLTLNLEYNNTLQQSTLRLEEIKRLIGCPMARKKALARALLETETQSITATKLHEVESYFRIVDLKHHANVGANTRDQRIARNNDDDDNKLLQLFVSAKVANIHETTYAPSDIATGQVKLGTSPSSFDSLAECFWKAAHTRINGPVLFAYSNGLCYIDADPILGNQSNKAATTSRNNNEFEITGSNMFELDWTKSKSLMRVWKFEANEDKKCKVWRWAVFSDLARHTLSLPLVDVDAPPGSDLPTYIHFQVAGVDLINNDWPFDAIADEDEILDGLGLIEGQRRVGQANDRTLDVGSCRAACMSDMNCKSYSICVDAKGLECITSGKTYFRDSKLLRAIEAKSSDAKQARKRKTIRIELDNESEKTSRYVDGQDDEAKASGNSDQANGKVSKLVIDLIVDSRCKIYNKRIQDMFTRRGREMETLREKGLIQVEYEAQCAQICLSRNLRYLRKISKLRKRYTEYFSQGKVDDGARLLRKKFFEYQKYWCATFKYLNLQESTMTSKLFVRMHSVRIYEGGICLLSRPGPAFDDSNPRDTSKKKAQQENNGTATLNVIMDTYEFVYKNLYNVQSGIRIMSSGEGNRKTLDAEGGSFADIDPDELVGMVHQRSMETTDIEKCARNCFLQTVDLDGSFCKSFDFIQLTLPTTRTKSVQKVISYCNLNSLSMADVKANPDLAMLVSTNQTSDMRTWHYEPRDEYMVVMSKVEDDLNREEHVRVVRSRIETNYAIALTVVVAMALGIALGTYAKEPVRRRWFANVNQPRGSISQPLESFFDDSALTGSKD